MGIKEELEHIGSSNDGILKPEAVVEFAKDENTELHSKFTWDDAVAGYQYRLQQARAIIVSVKIEDGSPVQAWVSLVPDRQNSGGGYRRTRDVVENEVTRKMLLQNALDEATRWRSKHSLLKEFQPVFDAIDGVDV